MSSKVKKPNDRRKYMRQYQQKNAKRLKAKRKEYYQQNREQILAKGKAYREQPEVREHCINRCREYHKIHREELNAKVRLRYAKNKEKYKGSYMTWRNKNLERAREKEREKNRRYRLIPQKRLSHIIGRHINRVLHRQKKWRRWKEILGYTTVDLMKHIEQQLLEGMTWDNYGKWHIDHIIPVSFFQYSSSEDVEFKMCWRLENLRPLWAKDNLHKSDKVVKQCPMSLAG